MTAPNILLCFCDELRWCQLGCYGHETIRTPHLDALARDSLQFEYAVSNCPVCMPARTLLMAGQYARSCYGATYNRSVATDAGYNIMPQWPPEEREVVPQPSLPELLSKAGYHSAALGKWHIESWPDQMGFDEYLICANRHAHSAQWYCDNGRRVVSPPGYSVDFEVGHLSEWLAGRKDAGQPWFMYYNISPPHMPLLDMPEKYIHMYGREEVRQRANVHPNPNAAAARQAYLTYLWDYRYSQDKLPYTRHLPSPDFDLVDLEALYMGAVSWVDDTVGRMLAGLEAAGMRENTLVVFCSDHGDNLGSHGLMGKGSLNDESVRIPLLVSGPGVQAGHNRSQVASLVDLAPTFLACAGAEPAAHLHGQNLLPILRGEAACTEQPHAFIETEKQGVAVRSTDTLLGLDWAEDRALGDTPSRLYHCEDDPLQRTNLADDEEARRAAGGLEASLRAWNATTPWLD